VEIVDGELLVVQDKLRDDGDVLGEDLGELLSDDAADTRVGNVVAHRAPLVRVIVAAHCDLLDSLQDGVVVDGLDVLLDSLVGGVLH